MGSTSGNGSGGSSLESPFQLEKVEGRQVEAFSPGAAATAAIVIAAALALECFSSFHLLEH